MNQVPQAPAKPRTVASPATSLVASLAMLAHASIGMVGLVAWTRTPSIVSWRLGVAVLATLLAMVASATLWLVPSKKWALLGLAVLLLALVRLGLPTTWSHTSWGLVGATVLLSLPLIRASVALD